MRARVLVLVTSWTLTGFFATDYVPWSVGAHDRARRGAPRRGRPRRPQAPRAHLRILELSAERRTPGPAHRGRRRGPRRASPHRARAPRRRRPRDDGHDPAGGGRAAQGKRLRSRDRRGPGDHRGLRSQGARGDAAHDRRAAHLRTGGGRRGRAAHGQDPRARARGVARHRRLRPDAVARRDPCPREAGRGVGTSRSPGHHRHDPRSRGRRAQRLPDHPGVAHERPQVRGPAAPRRPSRCGARGTRSR